METDRSYAPGPGLELLKSRSPAAPASVSFGTLVDVAPDGSLRVASPHTGWTPREAVSTVPATRADVGRRVVLAFEGGDPERPVVMGLVQRAEPAPSASADAAARLPVGAARRVRVDGDTVTIEADRELELRCGQSSITLRASGEVYLKGVKIVSRARGTHKIKGASVLIN